MRMVCSWRHAVGAWILAVCFSPIAFAEGVANAPAQTTQTPSAPVVAPAAPGGTGAVAPAETTLSADAQVAQEMRSLDEKVTQLKQDIFKSKAQLLLLQEKAIHGYAAGARAKISLVDDLSNNYVVESVVISMDDSTIFEKIGGELASAGELPVFQGNLSTGNHLILVSVVLRGRESSVFSYVKDYQFRLTSSQALVVEDGKTQNVSIRLVEKGGIAASFTERPSVSFKIESTSSYSNGQPE